MSATVFIWQALVPLLEANGIHSWEALCAWLKETRIGARPARRRYPLPEAARKSLPDAPGVYRFVRKNGDVLYVGKATSLKKRVAQHFKSSGPTTERALEFLTQVSAIEPTQTDSLLEAALLEVDEIKRLDPPYNVQLRQLDRRAWFATRDGTGVSTTADAEHHVGPLPSEGALMSLPALLSLIGGQPATTELRARVLAVPVAYLPEEALFAEGWSAFVAEHFSAAPCAARRVDRSVAQASLQLWKARGYAEIESSAEEAPPDSWDVPRVRRRLERALVHTGLLARRGRFLCLLADATVAFREVSAERARLLVVRAGQVTEREDTAAVGDLSTYAGPAPRPLADRRATFDAAVYDRLRVLLTELRRIRAEGGEVAFRIGAHVFLADRCGAILSAL